MPNERFPSDDPREWLNRAHSDLALGLLQRPDVYLEDFCFHLQQAAEKALKALLLQRVGTFPYVHDLGQLVRLLAESGIEVPAEIEEADQLTPFAVLLRYPFAHSVNSEDYERTKTIAQRVVAWVEQHLR